MKAELSVLGGPYAGTTIPLTNGNFLIGREKDCHFRPDSELVSRHHCVFRQDDYTLRVRDMGSRNGTFVNGRKIQGEVVLTSEDTLLVGDLTIKVIIHDPAETGTSTEDTQELALDGTKIYGGSTLPAMTDSAPQPQTDPGDQENRFPTPVVPPKALAPKSSPSDTTDQSSS